MTDSQWEHQELSKVTIRSFRGHIGGVNSCCYLNGENLIVSGGDDHTLRIWDTHAGNERKSLAGHKAPVTCCRSTPDGRKIASTGLDKFLIIWDTYTGQPTIESRHDGLAMACDISSDGKYVLSSSDIDNIVMLWDLRQEKSIKTMKYHQSTVLSCRFARNSYRFCTTGMDLKSVVGHVLDYRDEVIPHRIFNLKGHINMISSCDFSGDERRLCTGSWDKTIMLWDIHAGSYRKEGPVILQGEHDGSVSGCRFTKDGSMVLSASYDEFLVMWDVENACKKYSLQGHTGWVTDCDFSNDELAVISSSKDGSVRYWNIERCDEIPQILQSRKNIGLHLTQCQGCGKPFSIAQAQIQIVDSIKYCVFCRLDE